MDSDKRRKLLERLNGIEPPVIVLVNDNMDVDVVAKDLNKLKVRNWNSKVINAIVYKFAAIATDLIPICYSVFLNFWDLLLKI